jgi:hypothetical protein
VRSVAGVVKTGTGACEAGGAAAGATTLAAGALAPMAAGLLAAVFFLVALTGVQTLTFFFLPWTFLVTVLQVFLTLAAALLCALAFALACGFLFLAAPTISPGSRPSAPVA